MSCLLIACKWLQIECQRRFYFIDIFTEVEDQAASKIVDLAAAAAAAGRPEGPYKEQRSPDLFTMQYIHYRLLLFLLLYSARFLI